MPTSVTERSWDVLKAIAEAIRFSDTKAGMLLALAGGSAAVLSTKADAFHSTLMQSGTQWAGAVLYVLLVVYLVSVLIATICALQSIRPNRDEGAPRSILFFDHIAKDFGADGKQYGERLARMTDEMWQEELANQITANAIVASRKFSLVARSSLALAVTFSSWGFIVLLLLWLGSKA